MIEAREEKTARYDEGSKRKQQSESNTDPRSIGESGLGEPSSTESSSSKRSRRECSSCEPSSDSKSASEESSSSNGSSSDSGEETWRQSLVQRSSTSSELPDPHSALDLIPGESGWSETSPSNSKEETPSSVSTIQSVSRKSSSSGSSSSSSSSSDSAGEMRRRTLSRRGPSDSSDPESNLGSE